MTQPPRRWPLLATLRHGAPVAYWYIGACAFVLGGLLIVRHVALLRTLEDRGVTAATTLAASVQRVDMLRKQIEVAELHEALITGSREELVRTAVLPAKPDPGALAATLGDMLAAGKRAGLFVSAAAVQVGEPVPGLAGLLPGQPVMLDVLATPEGADALTTLIDLSGLLTVGDILSGDDRALLTRLTEEESPAAMVALDEFLSADLLAYARDPQTAEQLLLRGFASPLAERALYGVTQQSTLRDARETLMGPLGSALIEGNAWPMRLLLPLGVHRQEADKGLVRIAMTVVAPLRDAGDGL